MLRVDRHPIHVHLVLAPVFGVGASIHCQVDVHLHQPEEARVSLSYDR